MTDVMKESERLAKDGKLPSWCPDGVATVWPKRQVAWLLNSGMSSTIVHVKTKIPLSQILRIARHCPRSQGGLDGATIEQFADLSKGWSMK